MTAAISTAGVTKSYGGPALALGPVDLAVHAHELVALVGPNGAGKTTFIEIVAGLQRPTAGRISVFGVEPGSPEARRRVALIGDQPSMYSELSVEEHAEFVEDLSSVSAEGSRTDEVLEALGLQSRREWLPGELSKGLRQRAWIALGFIRPADLILADEPYAALDRDSRAALTRLFRQRCDEGAAAVVVSHQQDLLHAADRVVAFEEGRVVYDGPIGGYRGQDAEESEAG